MGLFTDTLIPESVVLILLNKNKKYIFKTALRNSTKVMFYKPFQDKVSIKP